MGLSELSGWIDAPDDPWVGFLIERVAHVEAFKYADSGISIAELPLLVRVKPTPVKAIARDEFPVGEFLYRIHPDDVANHFTIRGGRDNLHVCLHMGRFVE